MKRSTFATTVAITLLPFCASLAYGNIIVDQQNLVDDMTNSLKFSGAGQSFTPTLNAIDVAQFVLAADSASLMLTLYQGDGIFGPIIGTSAPVALSGGAFQTVTFNLLSPVALTPGNQYTLFVSALTCVGPPLCSSGGFGQEFSNANPYAGGDAFDASGFESTPTDLVFTEGIATPEPAALSLFGIGLFGIFAAL